MLHFSKQSSPSHVVKKHTDGGDISWQLAMHFGEWKGGSLVCYDKTGKKIERSFDTTRELVKFDGRLPHEVVFDNFEGVRYSMICFQSFHKDKPTPDPLVETPHYVQM